MAVNLSLISSSVDVRDIPRTICIYPYIRKGGPRESWHKKLQNLDPMNQSQRKLGLMYVLHMYNT